MTLPAQAPDHSRQSAEASASGRLIQLALRHKSDKWNNHWFAEIYERHFESRRLRKLSLLEIGIGGHEDPEEACATLRMWEEYFPNGTIYGLDKRLKSSLSKGRVITIEGSQSDTELLRNLDIQAGGLDIVIDNGSHLSPDVLNTFKTLFPLLSDGGIYAVECLQTSYWPLYGGSSNDLHRTETSVGYLKSLVDGLNFQERIAPGYEPSYTDTHVSGLHFHHNLALVEKGENLSKSNVVEHNMPRLGCEDICNGRAGVATVARASEAPVGADYSTFLIDSFCLMQLQSWANASFQIDDLATRLNIISVTHLNVFVFEIIDGEVMIHHSVAFQAMLDAGHQPESGRRAETYRRLLTEAAALYPLLKRIVLAIDVGDQAPQQTQVPVFSFQKRAGEVNPLLPDMEIVGLSYLEAVTTDPFPFDQKVTKAVFTGSTSGKPIITMQDINSGAVPRLRAARFFRDIEQVDFNLSNVVQCETEEVARRLRDEGHGSGWVEWIDNFKSKFLISIDGNGAPCSRPAIALRSNSALLKYSSPNVLYYSSGLVPWLHFIPIDEDIDVISIVSRELSQPNAFARVAQSGRAFADSVLTREAILAYTGKLLQQYSRLLI